MITNLFTMRKIAAFALLALLLPGCKAKPVFCLGFPNDILGWFPHTKGQTLHFQDQNGNDSTLVLSNAVYDLPYRVDPSPRHQIIGKKEITCKETRQLKSGPANSQLVVGFLVQTTGESTSNKQTRTPDDYNFRLMMGQPNFHNPSFEFTIAKDGTFTTYNTNNVALESNYTVGNVTYEMAIVCTDPPSNTSSNISQMVYAHQKGLVSFTTKSPQRTWIIQ